MSGLRMIRIIRPLNILIVFLVTLAAFILFSGEFSIPCIAGALALALAAASGNVLNDIFDIETDRINRPDRVLPSGELSPKSARYIYTLLLLLSLLPGVILGWGATLFIFGINLLLVLYSMHLKKLPLIGNVCVAFLTATSFIFAGFLTDKLNDSIYFAQFAFFSNLAREIVKDIQDIEGDRSAGMFTFPVRYGKNASRKLTLLAVFILDILIIASAVSERLNFRFLLIAGMTVIPLYIAVIFYLSRKDWETRLNTVSALLKFSMILGLIALMAGYEAVR